MKVILTKARKTDLGLRRRLAAMCDLSTIAFFRTGALLRRSEPVPGILAAHRSGAIMDKSGRPSVAISNRSAHQPNQPYPEQIKTTKNSNLKPNPVLPMF
jgi:hypothetical protein